MAAFSPIFPTRGLRGVFIPGALLLLLFSSSPVRSQPLQRSDTAQIEADMESTIQDKLNTLIGPRRSIVNVNVTLADQFADQAGQEVRALERLPGVQIKTPEQQEAVRQSGIFSPIISSIHITIDADDTLPEADLGTAPEYNGRIREAVSRWSRLNPARGDTLKINPMEWGDTAPPTGAQQNYLLYSILALVALLILIAAIYFPMRKLKGTAPAVAAAGAAGETGAAPSSGPAVAEEERRQEKRAELEAMQQALAGATSDTTESTLTSIKELMEQQLASGARDDSGILEEIRDMLGNPPQESDALLTEMRDTLSDMLDEQRKIAAKAGMAGAGAPGTAGGPAAGPAAAAGPMGEGGAGEAMGAEIVEALGNLEEMMAQQLEKTPDKEGIDQPFKYLKSTDPEDIILLISDEEPKLAAAVLSQIDPKAAAAVFEALEDDKQFELARAMTQLTEEEDMAEEIKDFLERKLKIVRLHKDYEPVTGVRVLADILSTSRYAIAKVMLAKMESKNPAMAAEVRKRMFLFEDIQTLADKDVEILIHNLNPELLAHALADAAEESRSKFLKNMTEKAQEMVREDMESVKKVQIEEEGKELPFNQALLGVEQNIIDEIFRTVDRTTLKMALRGASEQVQEKFFSGLTERAVAMLREDLEVMGGISRARADEAQEEIMNILRQLSSKTLSAQHEVIATIRKLEHEGQITVPRFQEETV